MKKIAASLLTYLPLFFFLLPIFLPTAAITFTDPSVGGPCGTDQQNTALGCITIGTGNKNLPIGVLSFFLKWAFGISGGVIILMLIFTGFSLATSSGNPEKLQAAKENMVSIFSGFILIVFSVLLLRTIGADVLILPTF